MLSRALELAGRGFRLVPLHSVNDGVCSCDKADRCAASAGKHPRLTQWQRRASSARELVEEWWERWPDANIGIAMGGPGRLVALDVDGAEGRATLERLEAEHGPLPDTLTARSGRDEGGEHRLFEVPGELAIERIPNGVGRARGSRHPGIDIRAEGGQIVAPPSLHYTGRRYAWVDADTPIAELPAWLYEVITERAEPEPEPEPIEVEATLVQRVTRASAYLARIEGAIEGQHGGTATFIAAQKIVRGFDLPELVAYDLMIREFNPRCRPPWKASDLRRKVHEADTKGTLARGSLLAAELPPPRAHRDVKPGKPSPAVGGPPPELPPEAFGDGGGGDDDERDEIELSSGELHRDVDSAVHALRRDPDLYQREGQLVSVIRIAETDAEAGTIDPKDGRARGMLAAGTPLIRQIAPPTLAERLSKSALFLRYDARKKDYRPTRPPKDIVAAVGARGEWPTVRPLTGVLEAPSLRPDGSIVQIAGYDPQTGYLLAPNTTFLAVPDRPWQAQANAALLELCEVWSEFPWASENDRYVPIAALLTLLARPAIAGSCPAFTLDASTAGSGKTLLADTIAALATGREAARMGWPPDPIELEKVLGSYAIRGASLISFDNVDTTFGGGALDRVLTATDRVELRVLGKSEVPSLRWRAVILASGNNITYGSDTTRRVLAARLEPKVERPQDRTGFTHRDLFAWVLQERARLVRAALTILRAYVVAGRPDTGVAPWGSYEPWTRLVAAAIAYAGGPDVLSCRIQDDAVVDVEKGALRTILAHWGRLDEQGCTAKTAVEALYPQERLRGNAGPDGFEDLREAIESVVSTVPGRAPSPSRLGRWLRGRKGRIVGGRRLATQSARGGVVRWVVVQSSNGNGSDPNHPHPNLPLYGGDGGDGGDVLDPSRGSWQG